MKAALEAEGAVVETIAPRLSFTTDDKQTMPADQSFLGAASVLFDAVYLPAGTDALAAEANALHFLNEAFKHCKAIAADSGAMSVIEATDFAGKIKGDPGFIAGDDPANITKAFIKAIAQHRVWEREKPRMVPA
jgi:catalase